MHGPYSQQIGTEVITAVPAVMQNCGYRVTWGHLRKSDCTRLLHTFGPSNRSKVTVFMNTNKYTSVFHCCTGEIPIISNLQTGGTDQQALSPFTTTGRT